VSSSKSKAGFIEPMLLLRTDRLPELPNQSYELKLDGYRALAIKTGGRVKLRSRNDNDFNGRYPAIVNALSAMPEFPVGVTHRLIMKHRVKLSVRTSP
jgi:bifunctional non-homologous end joining protein LigD